MIRKNKKIMSLLIALSVFFTSIGVPIKSTLAFENGIDVISAATENTKTIINEGFKGDKNETSLVSKGWIITRNGETATNLAGYDTSGNYGEASPALGLGRKKGSKIETLETPEFTLTTLGRLSFWYKGQTGNGPYTSTLKLEILRNGFWEEIAGPDIASSGSFETEIPEDTTKVKFSFNKTSGNLAIDDIKITSDKNTFPPVDGLVDISEARGSEKGTELVIRGVVSFNDRNKTLHIQDKTGGISISNHNTSIDFNNIKKGQMVEVKGIVGDFNKLVQVTPNEDVKILDENITVKAEKVSIKQLLKGNHDSKYVSITNAVIDTTEKTLTQGKDVLSIYYLPSDINVETGDIVNVEGTMGRFKDNIQIYGSSSTFTKVESSDLEAPVINHKAIKKAPKDADLEIVTDVTDNKNVENVVVSYRTKGTEPFKTLDMGKIGENKYSVNISKEELNINGLEYRISATDGINNRETQVYSVEITDEDMIGPEIFDVLPAENSSIGNELRPIIKASLRDRTAVNVETIKIFFDGKEVTNKAKITENLVEYNPNEDLKDGVHTVKIEVKDTLDNLSSKEWTFRKGELNHFFGQLHSHTNISDGTGTLNDAYNWARTNGADYLGVTDHSNWFDNDTKASLADGSASSVWTEANKTADKHDKNKDFTALYGYEMTWSGSTGGWGHINTFNTPGFETRTNKSMDLKTYYERLQTQPQSVSQLNHPGKTFGDFSDFGFYREKTDEVVNLIEVGNGEGPIRGSGYFASYEYYTRALDKGWHVAPTNNQDNHKGKWFTSNNARTVVISEENSRESLYDSMRSKQVYASEDSNMTIDYTANGALMGSSLGGVDKLNFKINIADDDAISKVSIIANGGVEVTSKEFNSNNVNWDFELNPEYTYYYVKVVQADKDIAVTAPIWVGDNINFGMIETTVDNELTTPNESVNISAGVYNNGDRALENIKIEFFENEINSDNKIGEEIIDRIESTKTETVELSWVPKKSGEFTIYTKATVSIEGKERVFTKSIKINVVNEEDISRVVIDGAHYNQYVTGDYAGKYSALKNILQERGAITNINKNPITDETLKNINLLILTDPQSRDKSEYDLLASKFENSEIDSIKRYVDNGGNIIVTTKADYGDGTGQYSNGIQMNSVLEKIGTELRVNDDQVVDDIKNGGQPYRLYLNQYDSPKYNLVNGIENGKSEYSFYSGASIILAEGATGKNVDFLVKGHETTTANDADNQEDNVKVEMGNVSVVGAEELKSGAKVIVSGNTFFSDFEIDGKNSESYSNINVTKNVLDWMLPKKEAKTVKIAEVRKDDNNDGIPDLQGEEFTVEGTVTSQSEAVTPKNAFFEVVYIEDETGGLCVFGVSNTELKVGQKVRVTGQVEHYQGEFEISIKDEDNQLEIIDENISEIKPTKLTTKESMLSINGGKLVEVEGKVVKMDGSNLYVDDGSGISRSYVEGYIWDGMNEESKGKWDPEIKVGDTISVIGLVSIDPEGERLRVRNTSEIKLLKNEEIPGGGEDSGGDQEGDSGSDNGSGNGNNSGNDSNLGSTDKNKTEGKLPQTGGVNSTVVMVLSIIVLVGGVILVFKKKKDK